MRIDKHLNRQGLTSRQLFFIECWSSLANRNNIDTDRATFNNPLNGIVELLDLYKSGDKYRAAQKRCHVAIELFEIIENDICLRAPEFNEIPNQILSLFKLNPSGQRDLRNLEEKNTLVVSFLRQLKILIEEHYVESSVNILRERLAAANDINEAEGDELYQITNMLMSTLLTIGMPLSECYLLYKNFLMKRLRKQPDGTESLIEFTDCFDAFVGKINNSNQRMRVSLKLISQRLYTLIESSDDRTNFQNCEFILIEHRKRNTVAVNIEVEAISYSAARAKADVDLNNALDIIAYMMNRSDIQVEKEYSACTLNINDEPVNIKTLVDFASPLVNASDRLSFNEFNLFIETISHLHDIADEKTINKVNSAFRFYQNGVNDTSQESRFTAIWSALESLTLGVHDDSLPHDQHVIKSVLPCIGLDYPVKQLYALRGVAKELRWQTVESENSSVDFKTVNLGEMYNALKDENIVHQVQIALQDYPYARFRFNKFISKCKNPYEIGCKIQEHRNKVELQVHRLYRVRNAIIHNASLHDRLDMLVVNLEHYLRSALNSMVYTMNNAPSISTPEEAFNRYQHLSDEILVQLDPSFLLSGKKKEGKRKEIENGNVHPTDQKLVTWLSMHS